MTPQDDSPAFRAGFAALAGPPNAGKSTLLNRILGENLAPVTPRPQTTDRSLAGILTREDYQIIFVDTPGIFSPGDLLGRSLIADLESSVRNSDLVVLLLDSTSPSSMTFEISPDIVALNKIDLVGDDELKDLSMKASKAYPEAEVLAISALGGEGVDLLVRAVGARLPVSPPLYENDQLTTMSIRDLVVSWIREACLDALRHELPYSTAVAVEDFDESRPNLARISAVLTVESESQKRIVIGAGGSMIKTIGIASRRRIEGFIGKKVHLALRVRVRRRWRRDRLILKDLGFKVPRGEG